MKRRCLCCGRLFTPRCNVPNQQYCSCKRCQNARRQRWRKQKLSNGNIGTDKLCLTRQNRYDPDSDFSDNEIKRRCQQHYGNDYFFPEGQLPHFRIRLASLSEFVRDIKVNFARYYNRRHSRRGYFWGDRFKSVIVDKGETLVNCLAYIDLNPLRAGITKTPENYRWSSIGYHLQTNNHGGPLSTDFGLKEFNVKSEKERVRRYRRYMYHAGSIDQPHKGNVKVNDPRILKREMRKGFEITRASQMRYK